MFLCKILWLDFGAYTASYNNLKSYHQNKCKNHFCHKKIFISIFHSPEMYVLSEVNCHSCFNYRMCAPCLAVRMTYSYDHHLRSHKFMLQKRQSNKNNGCCSFCLWESFFCFSFMRNVGFDAVPADEQHRLYYSHDLRTLKILRAPVSLAPAFRWTQMKIQSNLIPLTGSIAADKVSPQCLHIDPIRGKNLISPMVKSTPRSISVVLNTISHTKKSGK